MAERKLTIYTYPSNPRVQKALVAAQYVGVKVDVPPFEMGVTNKTPEFLAKFPLGKVPALETPEGGIFESNAIAAYIARLGPHANLFGHSNHEEALVEQFVHWCSNELESPLFLWVGPIKGYMNFDGKNHKIAVDDTHKAMAFLNSHLSKRTFLVGQRITLADISVFAPLSVAYTMIFPADVRAKYAHVTRWFLTLAAQSEFKTVFGDIELAAEEMKAQKGGKKDQGEKKEEKPKAEKPAKQEKAKKKEKEVEEEEEEESYEPPKPKELTEEQLWYQQKSPMDMDAVKRLFSNSPFDSAIPEFWQMYDPAVYSLYECNYNYNEYNTIEWQTANLMGGFLQRLEEARKIAFGSLVMTKCPKDDGSATYPLDGLFLFKYKEVPLPVKECPDAESYTWKKLDHGSDADKARIAAFWNANVNSIDNHEVAERRFFK